VKNNETKELVLIGGGRWAKIYLEEIIKKKIKINIITSNNNLEKFFINHKFKNYKIYRKLIDINIKGKFYIIIANATKDRLNIVKKIVSLKNEILIEKPLTNNPNDYFKYKLNKKNIYLSLQFSFADYFTLIKNKIKNEKIESLSIDWFDNKHEKKTFNNKINFIEDAYYHFFSIVRIFINNKNLIHNYSSIKKNQINSTYNNTVLTLNASKNKFNKKRILIIKTNKNKFIINFKSIDKVFIKKNENLDIKIIKNIKNIPIQINNFLLKNNKIKKNSLKNLNYLFNDLVKIKKYFSSN